MNWLYGILKYTTLKKNILLFNLKFFKLFVKARKKLKQKIIKNKDTFWILNLYIIIMLF